MPTIIISNKSTSNKKIPSNKSFIQITDVKPGQVVVLKKINAGKKATNVLAEMGIVGSIPIKVIRNSKKTPIIVLVRDTQVMLGRGLASKIIVEKSN